MSQVGHLEVLAQKVGADTTFSRILCHWWLRHRTRSLSAEDAGPLAAWYTPLIMGCQWRCALPRDIELSLTFLVISLPRALVVASPVAVVAGLGHAARKGILIKGGERLERIGKVDVVAFDKTGTLTLGRPRVSGVEAFVEASVEVSGRSAGKILSNEGWVTALAAAAELRSEHHLAKAILDYAKEQEIDPVEAREWALLPGLGAVAETEGGTVLVGNRRLLASRGVSLTPEQEESASRREAAGQTVAFVALRGVPVGLMGITDPLRPGVEGLVSGLKRAGVRKTVMLTGDNEHAARRVASLLGIDEVRAGLLPEKGSGHTRSSGCGTVVAMVGTGE